MKALTHGPEPAPRPAAKAMVMKRPAAKATKIPAAKATKIPKKAKRETAEPQMEPEPQNQTHHIMSKNFGKVTVALCADRTEVCGKQGDGSRQDMR